MGILEEISGMKEQGMEDRDILSSLRERGFTPKAIEDALNQIRIKNAISAEPSMEEGMEPSIMKANQGYGQAQSVPIYSPKTQELGHMHEGEIPRYNEYEQQEYVPQEGYGSQGTGYDTDTLIEIAEQVFLEKIKKEQKQINALNEFATLAETKISNNHERIKRIESIMDKLQIAILEKIGNYGKDLESIKNEMGMMQNSFEKMVPVLHEKESHLKIHSHSTSKKSSKKK